METQQTQRSQESPAQRMSHKEHRSLEEKHSWVFSQILSIVFRQIISKFFEYVLNVFFLISLTLRGELSDGFGQCGRTRPWPQWWSNHFSDNEPPGDGHKLGSGLWRDALVFNLIFLRWYNRYCFTKIQRRHEKTLPCDPSGSAPLTFYLNSPWPLILESPRAVPLKDIVNHWNAFIKLST